LQCCRCSLCGTAHAINASPNLAWRFSTARPAASIWPSIIQARDIELPLGVQHFSLHHLAMDGAENRMRLENSAPQDAGGWNLLLSMRASDSDLSRSRRDAWRGRTQQYLRAPPESCVDPFTIYGSEDNTPRISPPKFHSVETDRLHTQIPMY